MTVAKDDFRCAVCVKRHEVAAQVLNEGLNIHAPPRLECRALPPIQDVARHAGYPTVEPDFYCHVYFQADADAVKAQREAAKSTATLDAKVAETQARAEVAAAQPQLELAPAEDAKDQPAPVRARRARGKARS